MHITASVIIKDDESGLHQDDEKWLEKLASHEPISQYRHNDIGEDNANAPMKRQVMGREVVLAITNGQLYLATTATGRTSMLEDLTRCVLIHTPSWSVVSDEQIVSSAILKSLQLREATRPTYKAISRNIPGFMTPWARTYRIETRANEMPSG